MIKPLLDQLQAMLAFGQKINDPLATKVKDMGNLGNRLHDVYQAQQTVAQVLLPPDYKSQSIANLIEGFFNAASIKQGSSADLLSELTDFVQREVTKAQ